MDGVDGEAEAEDTEEVLIADEDFSHDLIPFVTPGNIACSVSIAASSGIYQNLPSKTS